MQGATNNCRNPCTGKQCHLHVVLPGQWTLFGFGVRLRAWLQGTKKKGVEEVYSSFCRKIWDFFDVLDNQMSRDGHATSWLTKCDVHGEIWKKFISSILNDKKKGAIMEIEGENETIIALKATSSKRSKIKFLSTYFPHIGDYFEFPRYPGCKNKFGLKFQAILREFWVNSWKTSRRIWGTFEVISNFWRNFEENFTRKLMEFYSNRGKMIKKLENFEKIR